jgi:hypothetical protein
MAVVSAPVPQPRSNHRWRANGASQVTNRAAIALLQRPIRASYCSANSEGRLGSVDAANISIPSRKKALDTAPAIILVFNKILD